MNSQDHSKYCSKYKICLIYLSVLLLVFISEYFYHELLLRLSFPVIRSIQSKILNSPFKLNVLEFFTECGTKNGIGVVLLFSYVFMSIKNSFLMVNVLSVGVFSDNLLKELYAKPRPYLLDMLIKPVDCELSFGNPSGHSLNSILFFLTLWHIMTDSEYFKQRKLMKYIFLISTIMFVFIIMFSRLALGAHSLNQLLFGFSVGVSIYFGIFHILEAKDIPVDTFFKLFSSFAYILTMTAIYTFTIVLNVCLIHFNNHDMKKYLTIIKEICPYKSLVHSFDYGATFNCFIIFFSIGSHIGVYILLRYMNLLSNGNYESEEISKEQYQKLNQWNDFELKNIVVRTILFVISTLPFHISLTVSDKSSKFTNYFFKMILPNFLASLLLFSISIIVYKNNLAEIQKDATDNKKEQIEEYQVISIKET